MNAVCKIESCTRLIKPRARGYCDTHYSRFRAAKDESKVKVEIAPRNVRDRFFKAALAMDTDDCIIWPFGLNPNGYGQYRVEGKAINAHRAMCIEAHGKPPFKGAQSAHSCGVRACINRRHLRWATPVDNHADMNLHGTSPRGERQGRARLTNEQALAVLMDPRGTVVVAADLGVGRDVIGKLRRGETYKEVHETHRRLAAKALLHMGRLDQ